MVLVDRGEGAVQTKGDEPLLTKFVIGDLALRSALQLEKARKNGRFSPEPLRRLAVALRQTSFPASAERAAALRPGYYESFTRLSINGVVTHPMQDAEIGNMLEWAVGNLNDLADGSGVGDRASALVDFCVQLHEEFVGRPAAEARFGPPGTVETSALVS
ncbi:MAG: hypothetical protein PGN12_01880 [Sphingomonas phyllosphaerae]